MFSFHGRPNPPPPPSADGYRFVRVDADQRDAALSVLLTGRASSDGPAVDTFLQFAREHGLSLDELWAVMEGKHPRAAALLVPGVGRTAMLFVSPAPSSGRADLTGRLVAQVLRHADGRRVQLIQSLLDAGQDMQQKALEAGGMRFLAELVYMHRAGKPLTDRPVAVLNGRALETRPWSEADRAAFAAAIEASYEGTLDCPGLRGLRDMEDVLAGHMSTGRFDPRNWSLYLERGRAVAVLLLAEAVNGTGMELVYLGLCPAARGRGLGSTLMHQALDTTARYGAGQLHLAVDAANVPALRLYKGLGFRATARKTALIFTPPARLADEVAET